MTTKWYTKPCVWVARETCAKSHYITIHYNYYRELPKNTQNITNIDRIVKREIL